MTAFYLSKSYNSQILKIYYYSLEYRRLSKCPWLFDVNVCVSCSIWTQWRQSTVSDASGDKPSKSKNIWVRWSSAKIRPETDRRNYQTTLRIITKPKNRTFLILYYGSYWTQNLIYFIDAKNSYAPNKSSHPRTKSDL